MVLYGEGIWKHEEPGLEKEPPIRSTEQNFPSSDRSPAPLSSGWQMWSVLPAKAIQNHPDDALTDRLPYYCPAMSMGRKPWAKDVVGLVLRGFAIGTADLVPGVSGGTVALVTGVYGRLVTAIEVCVQGAGELVKGNFPATAHCFRRTDWRFLASIVLGAGLAVVTLAGLIETLLREQPVRTAAVFFGLIGGAIVTAWRLLREPAVTHAAIVGMVGTAAFFLFGFRSTGVQDPEWYIFVAAGAAGICAFILPGVSGSFLLLAIGMYPHVLEAINDLHVPTLPAFAFGAVAGLSLFSRLLGWLLDRFHDLVIATMIGLMIGSFRILWPWPAGLGDENGVGATTLGAPGPDILVPILLATACAAAVIGFSTWGTRLRETPDDRPVQKGP